MKKLIVAVLLSSTISAIPSASADVAVFPIVTAFVFGLNAGKTLHNEPHYSLRDGCNLKNVAMNDGSGNRADSYAHCITLPRVYNGKKYS